MTHVYSQQTDDYYDEDYFEQNLSDDELFDPNKSTSQYHIQQVEIALQNLKVVVKDSRWKKILYHKSGVTVFSKSGGADDKLPMFMGEHIINGFAPQAIFAVIGMRKLWDDWYEEGSLIENLDETTSLTYMVMQALAGSKVRDLSLVEKIECAQNGTIYFVSTSVETPKVPRVTNRIRAHIVLNGWILEPLSFNPPRTKATYVLQIKLKGWVPPILSKTYLSRRPLVLHTIDQYLQKNGPPPMVISSTPPDSTRSSSTYQINKYRTPRKKHSYSYLNGTNSSNSTSQASPNHLDDFSPKSSPSTRSPLQPPQSPPSINTETFLSFAESPPKLTQHRHTASVQNAFGRFKSHLPMDDWKFYSEENGLKIYTKELAGKSTPVLRGDGVISGRFTTYDILSVIKNISDMRKLWDDRFEEGAIYEMFSSHERLLRTAMKGTFPISGRDMSVCELLDYDEVTGTLQFVTTSVVDQLIPDSKKLVRAHLDFAGWLLEPNFDSDGDTTSVNVTYIVDVDIKLDTIPSSIRKTLSVQIPMIVTRLNELMQKTGFPPYILNTNMKAIKEEFSIKNHQYDLSMIAKDGGVVEFKISKLMYPNGADVSTIPESCKIELLPDNSEIIRVTLPHRVDLDNFTVTITKYSNGFQFTYNHGQIIPSVSNFDINGRQSKQSKFNTRSVNATHVANGTIDNHFINNVPDIQKRRKSVPRNVLSPETFVNSSEVPSKRESYLFFDKQTLLENKIAAVTRASREVQSSSVQSSSGQSSSDPSEDTSQTEKSVVEKIKDEVTEDAGDLIIATDSIRFNSKQIGLMFASMLLAYYAGKLSI